MQILRSIRQSLSRAFRHAEPEAEDKAHYRPEAAFDRPFYEEITRKRLEHLESLQLPVAGKTVIDVGCGIGRLAEYFDRNGCDVTCVDGRAENIQQLRELYPARKAAVVDLETEEVLQQGTFDVVFCYGLLYHVVDVHGVIRRLAQLSRGIALIETCITPVRENLLRLMREYPQDVTQALGKWGSRPSPLYVETCLRQSGFKYLYSPKTKPDHPQFQYDFVATLADWPTDRLVRDIFIASREPIQNELLLLREDVR